MRCGGLWRIPGRWANWSLYDVADATALHEALTSLPLYPWMDIEVHPLAEHPNDPPTARHRAARPAPPGRDADETPRAHPIDVPRRRAGPSAVALRRDRPADSVIQVAWRGAPPGCRRAGLRRRRRTSDAALVSTYAAEDGGWDGFLPDCVLDPAVHRGRRLPRPIHGIGRLAMHALAGAGPVLARVARNEPIARRARPTPGVATAVATDGPTMVLSLSFEDIADDVGWRALRWPPP